MVEFYLRNSRNPDSKVVGVTVALSLDNLKPQAANVRLDQIPTATGSEYPNLRDLEGDGSWILIAETNEVDVSGVKIQPEFVNIVSTGTVHLEIEAALGRIGSQVDWGTILPDIKPPKLIEMTPALDQTTNVPITSNIVARLEEPLPAAGIDLSTVSATLNGFDITNDLELRGNIFDLTMVFRPTRVTT
jgi:hypothetical protein